MRRQLASTAATALVLAAAVGCGTSATDARSDASPSAGATVSSAPSAPPTITGTSALTIGQVCGDVEATTPHTDYGAPATPVQDAQFAAWATQLGQLAARGPAAQMAPVRALATAAKAASTSTDIFASAQQMSGATAVIRTACAKAKHPIYR